MKASLNDYNAPETLNAEPEIADVYGTLLDELNGKYERLLSLLQQSLANLADDDDKEVSCVFFAYFKGIPKDDFVRFLKYANFACKNSWKSVKIIPKVTVMVRKINLEFT